jgi:hypothetical protein
MVQLDTLGREQRQDHNRGPDDDHEREQRHEGRDKRLPVHAEPENAAMKWLERQRQDRRPEESRDVG